MDLFNAVAVSMLPASRSRAAAAFKELRLAAGSERVTLEAVLDACQIPAEQHDNLANEARERARASLEAARSTEMDPIPWNDARFPALLGCILDPPPVLWVKGDADTLGRPTVAVVGSRAATPYALEVAERLGEELADRGIVVASGLARGVDSAAHRGCLRAGGLTVAALGSGLDRIYPAEHRGLAANISGQGALVSELGPGAAPLPEHFPLRNRIISGISLAVVIVEASEKSGSLITVRYALEQGREVMAVPGSVLSGRNRGSHGLLKDGAKVVESADDILDGLGWPAVQPRSAIGPKSLQSDVLLERMEAGEVYRLDELMELTGLPGPRLLPRLMELELAGLVTGLGNGQFALGSRGRG
jgi:DNA processing protein